MFNLDAFISTHITHRTVSLFRADLERNRETLVREIRDQSVLVIGGAGTIGSSYIKVLLRYEPAKLVVVDISENGLTELTRDLRSTYGLIVPAVFKTYPVNFGDPVFERLLHSEGPFGIVANFAAHKHVRSEKDEHSITALLENNVIKAEHLLSLLGGSQEGGLTGSSVVSPPRHFFCVSTDKAANPVNVMGASKKVMEEVIMAYSSLFPITTARFANVAFSQGSLPDGFMHRMARHQPLSAPSDVKRYFVSPEESGEICLLACILGRSGDIFFPRLAEPQMMTFSEIAIAFLKEHGLEPVVCASEEDARAFFSDPTNLPPKPCHPDESRDPVTLHESPPVASVPVTLHESPPVASVPVTLHESPPDAPVRPYPVYFFASDTSGEKAYEEFFTAGEDVDLETYESLGVIKNAPRRPIEEIRQVTGLLKETLGRPGITKAEIVAVLSKLIPGFEHIETGKSLDSKM
jgi:FlaA1/EpsC-like NDP-sugar epimerase